MIKIVIRVLILILICSIVLIGQKKDASSRHKINLTIPSEAFGTFEGTQKSFVLYAGGYGMPMPATEWKLIIRNNKIEFFNYYNGETYLYTGKYTLIEIDSNSTGTLKCHLKILKDGSIDRYETTIKFRKDNEGKYYWVKAGEMKDEPETTLYRTVE
jgi:hypothetical protein